MKISIITVCYNSELTIKKTIESIINQSYTNIEYIIIDGLSTDRTIDIIKSYELKFKKKGVDFKYISERDDGIYDAMNKGIEISTGDYIGIINSDDWYEKDIIKKIVDELNNNRVDIIFGNLKIVKTDKIIEKNSSKDCYGIGFHPTVFIAKKIYQKYGKFDLNYRIAADSNFLLKLKKDKIKSQKLEEVIAYFSEGGISTKHKYLAREEYLKSLKSLKMISKYKFVIKKSYYLLLKYLNK